MFPVTVTLNNQAELQAVQAALAVLHVPTLSTSTFKHPTNEQLAAEVGKPAGKPEKNGAERRPAPTASTAPSAQEEEAAAPESSAEASPGDDHPAAEVDYDRDLKPRIIELTRKDRDAAVALLGKFGAKTGKDLKPEQYADALAQLQAALGD